MSYLENVWPVYSKRLLSNSGSYELSRIKALFNKMDKVRSVIFYQPQLHREVDKFAFLTLFRKSVVFITQSRSAGSASTYAYQFVIEGGRYVHMLFVMISDARPQ